MARAEFGARGVTGPTIVIQNRCIMRQKQFYNGNAQAGLSTFAVSLVSRGAPQQTLCLPDIVTVRYRSPPYKSTLRTMTSLPFLSLSGSST